MNTTQRQRLAVRRARKGAGLQLLGEPIDTGPFGLYDIRFFAPDDVIVSPARCTVSRVELLPHVRTLCVFDAASASLAQACQHKDSDRLQGAQWLLDMVTARYGVETVKFVPL